MTHYKGKTIDGVIFKNTADVDQHLREQAIYMHRVAYQTFLFRMDMASSSYANEKAEILVKEFGFDWEQIDELETQIMAACEAVA